ncbi:Peptidylprolyl isomerase [Mycena sanguinolenta]|uniref:Peptidylprolyl isomerase n=1 Tax=Mycena sanguinolenta TaxID=230812 RepID=A0A8H7CQM5_9AGAR|nr:Peptidylprolyl isomerase [Mycena sanguinolenta]
MDNTITASESHPRFPPELERPIFEMAALAHRRTIPKLVLVAARVKQWVEPLLYQVIMLWPVDQDLLGFPPLTVEVLLRVIATKSPDFLRNSVQHIYLGQPMGRGELKIVSAACSRVVNLFHLNAGISDPGVLGCLHHLRKLGLSCEDFLGCCRTDSCRAILNNLTHLELHAGPFDDITPYLPLLRSLTHISLNRAPHHHPLQTALCASTQLRCIIVVFRSWQPDKRLEAGACELLLLDPRFVCVHQYTSFNQDWLRGTDTGRSYWALADAFLAAKDEGKINSSRYSVSDLDLEWQLSTRD